jgi:hypothetical protein
MTEQALSMDDAKLKLARLEDHIPDSPNELIYKFGRFLAERLNSELVPMGFVMGCELVLYDLEQGVDGFTGKPIQNGLAGYPPMIYGLLRMEIPNIATAVFPEDFANSVKDHIDAVNAKVREERASV